MTEQPHVRDLLAAYALDAVTPPEAALVESHLATCRACQELLAELRETTAHLPALAGELAPPPALRARLMATVAGEAGAEAQPGVAAPMPTRAPRGRASRWPGWTASPLVAAAAMVALLLVGAGVWRAYSAAHPRPTTTYAMAGTSLQPGIAGSLSYYKGDNHLHVDLRGLAPLADGRVYELWLVRGHYRVVQGIAAFRPAPDGREQLDLLGQDVPGYTMACLTVERAPRAPRPTLPLVALAAING